MAVLPGILLGVLQAVSPKGSTSRYEPRLASTGVRGEFSTKSAAKSNVALRIIIDLCCLNTARTSMPVG